MTSPNKSGDVFSAIMCWSAVSLFTQPPSHLHNYGGAP